MPNDDRQSQTNAPTNGEAAVSQLVTVESQREFDLLTGRRSERTFLKMYVEARTSGLLATISDRDWKTLCTLATYMDEDGHCFPSQAELARALGCSRQMANERVNSLARFRFHDKPVLLLEKEQRSTQGRWARNGYRVLPIASLSIFGDDISSPVSSQSVTPPKEGTDTTVNTVSRYLDTVDPLSGTVSSQTVTVGLDTNKNQTVNQNQTKISKIRKATTKKNARLELSEHTSRQRPLVDGFEAIGETINRRQPVHDRNVYDEDHQVLVDYMADFARELGDRASLKATTTRVVNLYHRSGLSREAFIGKLYEARAITKERQASIRTGRFPYYLSILEDLLGLRDGRSPTTTPE